VNRAPALVLGILLLFGSGCPSSDAVRDAAPASPERASIVVIASGDVGGDADPCGCRSKPTGGLARRVARVLAERERHAGATLAVDAGDAFFREPLMRLRSEPEARATAELQAEAMLRMGVQAIAVGDRDLALGVPYLKRIAERAGVVPLAANLRFVETGTPAFSRFVVVERSGKKIGIVGAGLEPDPSSEAAVAYERAGIRATSAEAAVAEAAKDARREGAAAVVALLHTGAARARALLKALPAGLVDLAVEAHDRSAAPLEKIAATALVLPGERGRVLKIISIDLTASGPPSIREAVAALEDATPADEKTKALEAAYREAIALVERSAASASYAGSKACAKCHAKETAQWKATKHAKTRATLAAVKQADNPDCRDCHATAARFTDVGCESCHGAAAEHAKKTAAPLRFGKVVPERVCWDCHRPGKDQKPFQYAERIALVRHGAVRH
jgi:2',3'-cyclic-nucleotide 2'-phosphodiesterase (5'-nucleotidase family)